MAKVLEDGYNNWVKTTRSSCCHHNLYFMEHLRDILKMSRFETFPSLNATILSLLI